LDGWWIGNKSRLIDNIANNVKRAITYEAPQSEGPGTTIPQPAGGVAPLEAPQSAALD
jgi:hypothetical protein